LIIAISGLHGTGKSTIAKKLAEELELKYFSTGKAFREMADNMDMSLEEFNQYVENHPEIDQKLDQKVVEIAKEEDDYVIESQLSGYLLKDIADYMILLTAPLEIRIKRMAERDEESIEEKLTETKIREDSEYQRFKDLYDIDVRDDDLKAEIFDLIIDTENLSIKGVLNKILEFIDN
jgi:cytidylate kinase